jgi:hypothetical protein
MLLQFDQGTRDRNIVIDDVSITPLPKNCKQLVMNGDAEYDETPRFWRSWVNAGKSSIELIQYGGSMAFQVQNRYHGDDGMYQLLDPGCMARGSKWRVAARLRIVRKGTTNGASCDPSDTNFNRGCPPIRIAGWQNGSKVFDEKYWMTNRPNWSTSGFNNFVTEFTVPTLLASCDRVAFAFRSFNFDWDLVVDDVSIVPI